jgi:hypothetical protein
MTICTGVCAETHICFRLQCQAAGVLHKPLVDSVITDTRDFEGIDDKDVFWGGGGA